MVNVRLTPILVAAVLLLTSCTPGRGAGPQAIDKSKSDAAPPDAGGVQVKAPRSTASNEILIAPTYTTGHTDYVEFKQDVVQIQSERGAPDVKTGIKRLYGMIRRVESASDKEVQITLTLDRAMHEKWSMYLRRWYDSDRLDNSDDLPILGKAINIVLNHVFQVKLNPRFEVVEVHGCEEAAAALAKTEDGIFAPEVERDFSEQRLKSNWFHFPGALFSNRPVKVGDTWKNSVDDLLPMRGPAKMHFECRLEKVEGSPGQRIATVTFKGKLELTGDTSKMDRFAQSYKSDWDGIAMFSEAHGDFTRRTQQTRTSLMFAGRSTTPASPPPDQLLMLTVEQNMRVTTMTEREAEKKANASASQPKPTSQPNAGSKGP